MLRTDSSCYGNTRVVAKTFVCCVTQVLGSIDSEIVDPAATSLSASGVVDQTAARYFLIVGCKFAENKAKICTSLTCRHITNPELLPVASLSDQSEELCCKDTGDRKSKEWFWGYQFSVRGGCHINA